MHVQDKPLKAYPWWLKPFFWSQKRRYGQVLKPGLLWARVPRLFAAVALLYGVLDRRRSPVDPVLRSLVTVRVSQINHCAFCVDINGATLARRAGTEDKVAALAGWRESTLFDARERAVLAYAEAMTYTDRDVGAGLVATLRNYFDDDGLVELTGLIAFQNLSSKFNAALDVAPQGFCQVPGLTDGFDDGAPPERR
ncbi:carboxymuconolactone decarboxylase family protein [Motiliproteus sp. SC1-56]|uniref:carboxymuconolactone decarboxylase family protein n=1 Tax=Motiliproteus sp. SC1-56 TaxID=2799565 RepID=UPI001A8EA8AD|nr:carboxymuconolactone decarboxylase family protein [Motiliproteus sp. SC1-56]